MKIYLAGPMRGREDFNFPAFNAAAAKLRAAGHEVFNPAEHDAAQYGAESMKTSTGSEEEVAHRLGLTGLQLARQCFEADTRWICRNADAIALLPGWQNSKGAQAERALCIAIGLQVLELGDAFA